MARYKVGDYYKFVDGDVYLIGRILKIKDLGYDIIVIDTNKSSWRNFSWFDFHSPMDINLKIITKDEAMVESL